GVPEEGEAPAAIQALPVPAAVQALPTSGQPADLLICCVVNFVLYWMFVGLCWMLIGLVLYGLLLCLIVGPIWA
ncbi:Os04g0174200, partial [Oryza sativa Japonica Group]